VRRGWRGLNPRRPASLEQGMPALTSRLRRAGLGYLDVMATDPPLALEGGPEAGSLSSLAESAESGKARKPQAWGVTPSSISKSHVLPKALSPFTSAVAFASMNRVIGYFTSMPYCFDVCFCSFSQP
jgi:hypothetical protein